MSDNIVNDEADLIWPGPSAVLDGLIRHLNDLNSKPAAKALGNFSKIMTLGFAASAVAQAGIDDGWDGAYREGRAQAESYTGRVIGTYLGGLLGGVIGGPAGAAIGSGVGSYLGSNWRDYLDRFNKFTYAVVSYPTYSWTVSTTGFGDPVPYTKIDPSVGTLWSSYTGVYPDYDTPKEHIAPETSPSVAPRSFSPADPLTPIFHTPVAPSPSQPVAPSKPSRSTFNTGNHAEGGSSSRGDYSSGAHYSGSSSGGGGSSSSSNSGSASGSKNSTPGKGSPSGGVRDNQNTGSYGGSWGGSVSGASRSTSGKVSGPGPQRDNQDKNYGSWGGKAMSPILIDVSGNGLEIDPLFSSQHYQDMDQAGYQVRTAWAAAGTGVLVIDADGDEKISRTNEFAFTDWDPTAKTDLEALRNVFDTNGNGKLDSGDERWADFKVDVNGEMVTLDSLGITSIDLTPTGSGQTFPDGSTITGTTTFTRADGSTGAVGDALLAAEDQSYIIQKLNTIEADGSSLLEIRGYNSDGSLAFMNSVSASAEGSQVLTLFDDDGNGTVNRSQTLVTNVNADGSRSKIVSNFRADGSLTDRTASTRNADGSSILTSLDQDGDGVADQIQKFVRHTDGSTTTTTEVRSVDGALVAQTIVESSTDGLTKTTSMDQNGDGVFERVSSEITTVHADNSRSKIVSVRGGDGTLLSTATVSISADSRTQSSVSDEDGDGDIDTVMNKMIANVAGGAIVVKTTLSNYSLVQFSNIV